MLYIVYHKSHNGYYSGYKDKLSDTFSPNWFEAVKYKSLGAALTQLRIGGLESSSFDKFLEYNRPKNTEFKRDKKLNDLFNESSDPIDIIFSRGHIDKIKDGGGLERADEEVMKYITDRITKNKIKSDKYWAKVDKITGKKSSYIVESKEGEDFWDGF